jgi:hypothetical protein
MGPKGLAAAVLGSLPLPAKLSRGSMIQAVAYWVVLFSIALTSALVFPPDKTILRRLYEWIFSGFAERGLTPEESLKQPE